MNMALAEVRGIAGLFAPTRSTAKSNAAKNIKNMHDEARLNLFTSYAIGNRLENVLNELKEVRSETSTDGWDGYGANPLNPLAYEYAETFLNSLPTTAPLPEVSADPDGEVSLDWVFGERRALTVSIGPSGRCTFAAILGESSYRGTEWIDDEIPASIVFYLRRLAPTASARQER
jgi:hypothetical protein